MACLHLSKVASSRLSIKVGIFMLTMELDVHLWNTSEVKTTIVPPNGFLRFLSNVHVPSIPLCLCAGPSYEVSTDNANTAEWLSDRLELGRSCLQEVVDNESSDPWRSVATRQLAIGVLLGVEGSTSEGGATEILLYAEAQFQQYGRSTSSCPSPPMLSDRSLSDSPAVPPIVVKVYALPLCSDVLGKAQIASKSANVGLTALECPTVFQDSQVTRPLVRKRQRLSDILDNANRHRRELEGRGGEGVSKAVSGVVRTSSQREPEHVRSRGEPDVEQNTVQKHSSEAPKNASVPTSIETRPESRTGHRVFTVSNSGSNYVLQNKAALTKMVMAGMRLHGLQHKKKRDSISGDHVASEYDNISLGLDSLNDREDEYKLIYHQTFKAAIFAFRSHLSGRLIDKNTMRDVVDRLLILFCTDPASTVNRQDGFFPRPGASQQDNTDCFDLPSGRTPTETPVGMLWSTPSTKKRA